MADIVVYEDSPLAQYLQGTVAVVWRLCRVFSWSSQGECELNTDFFLYRCTTAFPEIQEEHPEGDLYHAAVPVHDPEPIPKFIGFRLAHNAVDMFTHFVEYLTHAFSSSASDTEDAEFEERFKYFICTSPFLNRTVTLHAHERNRRTDMSLTIEYASKFRPGRFSYVLGFGTLATLVARSVLARSRASRLPWIRPLLSRPAVASLALASSAWVLRILQRRNIHTSQNQALRSLQVLVNHCQVLDAKVNRAIMVIQEIELVSRGYRLSTPLAPISRIEQASKTRRCNMVRAQLVAALTKSGALFQRSTETLRSHIDHNRFSTLLDMYNHDSTRPASPNGSGLEGESPTTPRPHQYRHPSPTRDLATPQDTEFLTASPTSEIYPPMPSSNLGHTRHHSSSRRRSRTMTGVSRQNTRPRSFHEYGHSTSSVVEHPAQTSNGLNGTRTTRRHRTSWSASEGDDDSDNAPISTTISPRSSTFSHPDGSPNVLNSPELTSLERLRKNFQRMHAHRREFLCELLSIRRRSRQGRQGLNAWKDYDQNWTVVRDVLQEGVAGIENVVEELSKVLDSDLYTLPRIDTQNVKSENTNLDKQIQPFVQRLALLEHHIRGVQAKLYICSEDIKETINQDPMDIDKRQLLEMQFDSISQDISMMATEWQLGKTALNHALEPTTAKPMSIEKDLAVQLEEEDLGKHILDRQDSMDMRPILDSLEAIEDRHHLTHLSTKREETWEASTESGSSGSMSKRPGVVGLDGTRMTRAERIQYQKIQREQEQLKRERTNDSSRMVHELKDVLGRRRHLREGSDDDDPRASQLGSSLIPASTVPSSSADHYRTAIATSDIQGFGFHRAHLQTAQEDPQLMQNQRLSSSSSSSLLSPWPSAFLSTLEQKADGHDDNSFIEICGEGEADEDELPTEYALGSILA